jgi:hypothetical protein
VRFYNKKKVLLLAITIASVAIVAYLIMIGLSEMILSQQIERLYSTSRNISVNTFSSEQIKDLPEPVQKYFTYSLEEGQHYVSYVKLKHAGEFRQNENQKWMPIEGEEYFTTETPGFIWIGKISLLPLYGLQVLTCIQKGREYFK